MQRACPNGQVSLGVLAGVSPNRMQPTLLGDRQAQFKWFLHDEAPPSWRLMDGRGNNYLMKEKKYRFVKKNHLAGDSDFKMKSFEMTPRAPVLTCPKK